MRLALSRIHFPVTALGPGRRVGIWLQGCSIRCAGCISRDTWEPDFGDTDLNAVLARLTYLAQEADGLTVSGGEPFDQPGALAAILTGWRGVSGTSAAVFTGYELADVSDWLDTNNGLIDALITGPFRSDLPQTLAMRGSDNQQIHVLTPAGAPFGRFDRALRSEDRRLDVMFDEEGHAWIAGIPARGEIARLRRALASRGHSLLTSDMPEASTR